MKSLRIHYLQHASFEEPGYIESWAKQNHHPLSCTKPYESVLFPALSDFDWLIVLGGPMGVYEYEQYPWLIQEKEFIKNAIAANKPTIGICLGSQLIAAALGSKVYTNTKKEIGWFPLTKTPDGRNCTLLHDFPNEFTAFHWHGDTFDLPEGAVHLFQTSCCSNQAFLFGNHILALQFHLEVTSRTLASMIENCRQELKQDDFIQTEEQLLTLHSHCHLSNRLLAGLLDQFTYLTS